MSVFDHEYVLADIPGLIEGAHAVPVWGMNFCGMSKGLACWYIWSSRLLRISLTRCDNYAQIQ
ncbi:MAG UNVERIFIED_CONTAM: hypothetical protein LVR18_25340 [Planctomycetaceae bacterium]|jgi:hypothetical protein